MKYEIKVNNPKIFNGFKEKQLKERKGLCPECIFGSGLFGMVFGNSKKDEYTSLINNPNGKCYSGCAARAFLMKKYFGLDVMIYDTQNADYKYMVKCSNQAFNNLNYIQFVKKRNMKI